MSKWVYKLPWFKKSFATTKQIIKQKDRQKDRLNLPDINILVVIANAFSRLERNIVRAARDGT